MNELLAAFKEYAEGYYVQDGKPTTELKEFAAAARVAPNRAAMTSFRASPQRESSGQM